MSSGLFDTHVKLVKRNPLSAFAECVLASRRRLRRIILISPWVLATEKGDFAAMARIFSVVQDERTRLTVLSRHPDRPSFVRAVAMLDTMRSAAVMFLPGLHAKLYLLETEGLSIGLVGSPNFTLDGDTSNVEVAVEFRTTSPLAERSHIVSQLFGFAQELLSDRRATVHKVPAE